MSQMLLSQEENEVKGCLSQACLQEGRLAVLSHWWRESPSNPLPVPLGP